MAAPLFEFRNDALSLHRPSYYATHGKRLFDLALVAVMLPAVVSVIAIIALFTAIGGGQPFYSQMRVGRDGETFRCWKFRTMIPDADAALARILAEDPVLAAEWRQTQKLRRDPRVTRFGAFLRDRKSVV